MLTPLGPAHLAHMSRAAKTTPVTAIPPANRRAISLMPVSPRTGDLGVVPNPGYNMNRMVPDAYRHTDHRDPAGHGRRPLPGPVLLRAAALRRPDHRHGSRRDQPRRAPVRHRRPRRPDGPGVRRPPRRGRPADALGPPAHRPGTRS